MSRIGNTLYAKPADLPEVIPVFPLQGVLLLPRGQLPLNVFERRYMAMIDAAIAGDRVIGMVQPRFDGTAVDVNGNPELCPIGCAGRITQFAETGDGRYLVTLTGIARFRIREELAVSTPFRCCAVTAEEFAEDFMPGTGEESVDREGLLAAFRAFLEASNLEADWEEIGRTPNEALVNALSMLAPYGPAEKQALLEAPDLKTRAETLVAVTELALARGERGRSHPVQ